MSVRPTRILCWAQNLLGSGHLKRQLAIGRAAVDAGCKFTLLNGGMPVSFEVPQGIDWVQLPPIKAKSAQFDGLLGKDDRPVDQAYWQSRQTALRQATSQFAPDIVITEMFPFGRRKFRHEIFAWFETMPPKIKKVSSVRDVLVTPRKPQRAIEYRDWAIRHFDLILVHGDPAIQTFEESFPHTAAIASKIRYTGFVTDRTPKAKPSKNWAVVISVGSGIVGDRLIEAAIECHETGFLNHKPWLVVVGKQASATQFEHYRAKAGLQMQIERFRSDLPEQIGASELSISQAGYNTVAETLAVGTPMLVVPFHTATEDEQIKRAKRIESLKLAVLLEENDLSPRRLKAAMLRTRELPKKPSAIDLNGAVNAQQMLSALVQEQAG